MMEDNIQLNDPQAVLACISREAELLNWYAELIRQESKELAALESQVEEAGQTVNLRKRGVTVAIEQTKKQEASEYQEKSLQGLRKKLETIEKQSRQVGQCRDELIGLRQDAASLMKDSTANADNGRILAMKIQKLIEKIMEAK